MLTIFRNAGESVAIVDTASDKKYELKLIGQEFPCCEVSVNGQVSVKKIPESFNVGRCVVTIMSIDRGVKFGFVAPKDVKINRC